MLVLFVVVMCFFLIINLLVLLTPECICVMKKSDGNRETAAVAAVLEQLISLIRLKVWESGEKLHGERPPAGEGGSSPIKQGLCMERGGVGVGVGRGRGRRKKEAEEHLYNN
jgi:hypothetical protein